MPIEPPEIPPATPGTPTEPPPGIPPGNPNPEIPPPVHEPGAPPQPQELARQDAGRSADTRAEQSAHAQSRDRHHRMKIARHHTAGDNMELRFESSG